MKGLIKPIAAAVLIGLAGCGAEKSTEEYLASANSYLASDNTAAAVIELKNAVKQSPENVEARTILGDIYYAQGSYLAAEKEYRKALTDEADSNELAPKLALTFYKLGKNKELDNLIQDTPRLDTGPSATLSAIHALSYFNRGDVEKAEDALLIAEQQQSENIYTKLGQAALQASTSSKEDREQRVDIAINTVNEVLAVEPSNVEANLIAGHLKMAKADFAGAQTSFETVVELVPEAVQNQLYLAQSLIKQNKFDEAEPYVDKLLKLSPQHPLINEFKARIAYARQDFSEAKAASEMAVQNGSTNMTAFVIAGISSMKDNQYEQAYRYLSRVQGSLPDDHMINRLYAYLQLQLGYVDQATETLDRLTDLQDSDAMLFATATSELTKAGKEKKALSYAEKAASLDETGANTVKLGILKLANQDSSGITELESALNTNPDLIEARLALVYSLLNQNKPDEARKAADDLIQLHPDDSRGYTLKGLVEKLQGNGDQAIALLDQALEISANDPIALLSKSNVYMEQDKTEEAFAIAKQNIQYNAERSYVVRNFMAAAGQLDRGAEATEWVKQLYDADSNNANLLWAYGVGLAASNQKEQAIELLTSVPEEKQIPPTRQLLGDLYIQTNQLIKAEDVYKTWVELNPDSKQAHQRLIASNELQHDYSDALQNAKAAIREFPADSSFQLILATMLFENDQVRASRLAIEDMDDETAQHPVAVRLQARIALHQKDFDKGIELWRQYYEMRPTVRNLTSLADVYELTGNSEKAIEVIEADMGNFTNTTPSHLKLAHLYMGTDSAKSAQHYEAVLAENPGNVMALNNLAWLHLEEGQFGPAKEYSERAYKAAGKHPAIADTYGFALLKTGNSAKALEVLQTAYEADSSNQEIAIHYAAALVANSQKTQAKQVLSTTTPPTEALETLKAELMSQL
ncbi:XrtA/PEP-CTERM system TPR-repeat protein PrsT [Echinimonas agarilytica]|uniref:PEP-CTERM system TPR-repeat protein PrsT n=1 Tax=Echinimonas agarilytica TaxID=1215918 RepID=A0AA41WA65_9GAMM|nr:XrtA/PEP-CTERM system TPR-repeat protein PrsT [Echinimonas agarilytica]MCM2681510.1 PEP-CTERM system TPR-repeat protein PrsT [Echinimonas agarilytica]